MFNFFKKQNEDLKIYLFFSGQIDINKAVNKKYKIGKKYNYAIVNFNKENDEMIISFTNDSHKKDCIKLQKHNKKIYIIIDNFCYIFDIDMNLFKIKPYNFKYDEEKEAFIIKLERRESREINVQFKTDSPPKDGTVIVGLFEELDGSKNIYTVQSDGEDDIQSCPWAWWIYPENGLYFSEDPIMWTELKNFEENV
jgi:hypothetical protein